MTKEELRAAIIADRTRIDPEHRNLLNMLVFERAHKHAAFQSASLVHIFRSTPVEVNTLPFIEYAWAIGKQVAVPRIDSVSNAMQHVIVTRSTRWQVGSFGIPEPSVEPHDIILSERAFDAATAILVPFVAFDRTCQRLGYGKGYYDRFLAHCDGVTIGIGYEMQRVEHVPAESHDISLHAIATDERWYRS